ncbi:hypothetical protein V757_11235 [Pelistega indica]|uniref:Uncharacterized protein n=1 Tax=Pelistega indica TaxID=1414851 RepID=V8FTU7_9BURK|nr:hypothetical protein [Pelistega indica]ETD67555.1 hypothetical protein V757_11235 [Pelistega indica]
MGLLSSIVGAVTGAASGGGSGGGCGVDGESYIEASDLASKAMTAVALINTAAATSIAVKQLTLANKYYALAKEARDYWNSTFKPHEVKMMDEAGNAPLYTPQFDVTAGRWLASTKQQFKKSIDTIGIHASRYCTGLTQTLMRDAMVAKAMAEGDTINLAYRYEEGRKQIFDEIRWTRRHQALAMGRDMLSQSAGYMQQANASYGTLRDWTTGNANGAYQQWWAMNSVQNNPYTSGQMGQGDNRSQRLSDSINAGASGANRMTVMSGVNLGTGAIYGALGSSAVNNFTSAGATNTIYSGAGTPFNIAGSSVAPGSPNGALPYNATVGFGGTAT